MCGVEDDWDVTTVLLVRHAMCDPVGVRLAGRAPGISLNADGRAQAAALASRIANSAAPPLAAIYTSPLERTRETADVLGSAIGLTPVALPAVTELDFGLWTGLTFAELETNAEWRRFNRFRSSTRVPGGELMLQGQARAVAAMEDLRKRHVDERVVVVSHSDIIKAVIAHYVGVSLDDMWRLEIEPASTSVLSFEQWGDRLVRLNDTGRSVWGEAADT